MSFYSLSFIHLFVFQCLWNQPEVNRDRRFSHVLNVSFSKRQKKKKKGFDVWFLNQTTWNFSVFGCFISFLMTWLHSPFLSSYQISFSSPINHQTGAFYWNKSHKSADRDSVSCLRTLQAGQSLNMNPPDEWKAVNMVNGKKKKKRNQDIFFQNNVRVCSSSGQFSVIVS